MNNFLQKLKKFPSALLDVIYPEKVTCLICQNELNTSVEGVCPECYNKLPFITDKTCLKCGQPLDDMSNYCNRCKDEEIFYKEAAAVFEYDKTVKNLIFRFKDDNQKYLNNFLAFALSQKYAKLGFDCDLAVYVPIHKKKLKRRGFNQAEKLCKRFCELIEMPISGGNLIKTTYTGQQKLLRKQDRIKNLENSFAVNEKPEFKGKNVLLIDDIMTTGATANECAKVLNRAGAKNVYVLALATVKLKIAEEFNEEDKKEKKIRKNKRQNIELD